MKLVKRPGPLFKGERIVGVDPPIATHISQRWNRRLNHYPGRTLTHSALNIEQRNHASRLSLYGGQLSPGVVRGLALNLAAPAGPQGGEGDEPPPGPELFLQPGSGLTAAGEDVNLSQAMRINVQALPVFGQAPDDPAPPQGLGVLLVQPIMAHSIDQFDELDPCELDPNNDAFEDYQVVDGLRLAWFSWPIDWPQPAPGNPDRLRNRAAYLIYDHERQADGVALPWEAVGVPLALIHILTDGSIDFIDRHAVARQGGIPNPRGSLLAGAGTAFLWQARVLGLTDHMQTLRDRGLDLEQAVEHFQYLPPVGVLPPDVVDFSTNRSGLFPSQYTVEAAPVPLEQFELAVEASASAQPFDLFVPDRMKVLVPVPQQFYEPRLLQRESVDPLFQQTISELLKELNAELGRRLELRQMASTVVGGIDPEQVPDYPAQDPLAVPGELPASEYPQLSQHDAATVMQLTELHSWLDDNAPLTDEELAMIDAEVLGTAVFEGVQELIEDLQAKVDTSNHKIDFGFLRVQTDIYRLRQMMLGNVEATRLATSPVLANIAQGLSSQASQENLRDYFGKLTAKSGRTTGIEISADDSSSGGSGAVAGGGGAAVLATGGGTGTAFRMVNADLSDLRFAVSDGAATRNAPEATTPLAMAALPGIGQPPAQMNYVYATQPFQVTAEDIQSQSPIIGETLEFRSTAVAERIAEPPAPEARSYAVASKAAVYADLGDLPINIEGIEIAMSGSESAVITNEQYKNWLTGLQPGDSESAVLSPRTRTSGDDVIINLGPFSDAERKLLGALEGHLRSGLNSLVGANKRALKTPGLSGLVLSGMYDPHPGNGDEGAFLSVGVSALESTVSTLRRVERRINGYKKAVARCRTYLKKLQSIQGLWQTDLDQSNDRLREHRHDLTVARALLQEEQARITGINQRRQDILAEHVSFIGYMRPRTVSLRKDMPALKIHGEFRDPVPVCLTTDLPAPGELQDTVNLFREVPLKWLPNTRSILFKLDTYDVLKSVFSIARQKATQRLQSTQDDAPTTTIGSQALQSRHKYQKAVYGLVSAHRQTQLSFIQHKAGLNLQLLDKMSWKEVNVKAQDDLSLQDLIESGKGKSGLAQRAARELEDIQDVAVCLYGRMGDVAPAFRLLWADKLSEFDQPVGLENFEVLPQWDRLDFELRRDLQRLGQWLFYRVDRKIPGAVNLMNDLLRICILLASHAPVSSIINGHLPAPVTGKVGDVVKLAIDKGLVRVGMEVGIYSGLAVAVQGVVEDLSADEAMVKVTSSQQLTYHLESGARAQFYQARQHPGLLR